MYSKGHRRRAPATHYPAYYTCDLLWLAAVLGWRWAGMEFACPVLKPIAETLEGDLPAGGLCQGHGDWDIWPPLCQLFLFFFNYAKCWDWHKLLWQGAEWAQPCLTRTNETGAVETSATRRETSSLGSSPAHASLRSRNTRVFPLRRRNTAAKWGISSAQMRLCVCVGVWARVCEVRLWSH